MKRIFVGSATLLIAMTTTAMSGEAQRRTSVGVAAGASVPVGDLGDGVSTGFHVLGTLSVSGTASSPLGFRDRIYCPQKPSCGGPSWSREC